MLIKPPTSDPVCRGCKHFGVSYDINQPYVCRAMGFKSKVIPVWEVRSVVSHMCLAFEPRPPQKKAVRRPRVNVRV